MRLEIWQRAVRITMVMSVHCFKTPRILTCEVSSSIDCMPWLHIQALMKSIVLMKDPSTKITFINIADDNGYAIDWWNYWMLLIESRIGLSDDRDLRQETASKRLQLWDLGYHHSLVVGFRTCFTLLETWRVIISLIWSPNWQLIQWRSCAIKKLGW